MIRVGTNQYEVLVASDGSTRDGLGLEVFGPVPSGKQLIEIFRSDRDGAVTFSAFELDIPLELVQRACRLAHERLSINGMVEEL